MSLPKKIQNLRRESMPYEVMKEAEITDHGYAISGDIVYHNENGEFKLSHYENQGGNPVNYVLQRKTNDKPMFYTWTKSNIRLKPDIWMDGKFVLGADVKIIFFLISKDIYI